MAISLLILAAIFYECRAQNREIEADQPAFKTVHMFNLKPEFSLADLQTILEKFNALFIQLGHPESQYRLWEISEEKEGSVRYFWESNWSSKSVYDEIHKNEAYRKLFNEALAKTKFIVKEARVKVLITPTEGSKKRSNNMLVKSQIHIKRKPKSTNCNQDRLSLSTEE